nr:retrotransposon protein, putative, LINE subclass [Oryza sativa Japonica Group]
MPGIRNDSHNLATESFGLQQSDNNKIVRGGSVAIKVNDEAGNFFQGDPLSPILFNLVADMLAILIKRANERGSFHGVILHLVDNGLSILQYADDTIILMEHDLEDAKNLKLVLNTFESLAMFMLSFFEVPKGILEKLDYYRSRFFWQCEEHKKKYRLAKWSILCKPKECGGLGIQNLELQNKCMLSKWLYKLWNEERVWQNLLRRKYLSKKTLTHVEKKPGDSHFWSGLMMVKNIFLSCGSLKVHNGTQEGYCGSYLKAWLEVVSKVISIKLTEQNGTFLWEIQKNGRFSVNSMYKAIMYREVVPKKDMIWKLRIPLKIKIFLWYLKNGVILTKDNLAKRKWKGDFQGDFLGKTMVFAT